MRWLFFSWIVLVSFPFILVQLFVDGWRLLVGDPESETKTIGRDK